MKHKLFKNITVNRDGSIIGSKGKILKQRMDKYGYLTISVYCNGKRKTKLAHRIIAETYIPNPHGKPQVNHLDGNKTNNSVENLEWTTPSENTKHAFDTGLASVKLSKGDVIKIYENKTSLNPSELAKEFNVSRNTIYSIIHDNKRTDITEKLTKNYVKESKQAHKQLCIGISPTGEEFLFDNKTKFAREHGLNFNCIIRCVRGEAAHHKQWKFKAINV